MSAIFLTSVLVVLLCIGTIFLTIYGIRIRRINGAFEALAERYGGQFVRAGFRRHACVWFTHEGNVVAISTEQARGGGELVETVFRCTWPDSALSLEVTPARFYTGVVRLFGGRDILTSNQRFDREYSARGNDAEQVRAVLSAGVQTQIDLLRRLPPGRDFHLAIGNGALVVRKRGILLDPTPLVRFTSLTLELIDQVMLTNMAGIEIVSQSSAPLLGQATCSVCGDPIGADIVYCRICNTPHHHECWIYNGVCAVYGCGERKYLAGRRARRILTASQVTG